MSLFDEINKRTQLPKPRSSAQFETIEASTDDEANPPVVFNRNCKSKNIKLYNPDPEDYIGESSDTNIRVNEFEITSSILELNGGDCHSNKAIEERWKARVSQKQAQQKNDECKFEKKESTTENLKKRNCDSGNYQYKNNALMRNLLEQKMAELDVSNLLSSSSDGGS
ncbi:hypothetical protein PV328_002762 [Microctonus aethiopoides]|uniref:Uncharacterized protein n=1 Tax=Microctonus aethiopoides TaxID=144406 RepID=A0AA39F733_9HYME|nr:hypothetical protein PV328_002762 [Microctonus aethiopoides]